MILKLVPGQSVQPLGLITSSTTCRAHSVSPKAQIQQPFSCTAPIKAFVPRPTTAVVPETLIRAAQPRSDSEKTVLVPNCNQCLIVKPYGPAEVNLDASSNQEEDNIRTFSKISYVSPKPNCAIQWVIEDMERSPNQTSGPSSDAGKDQRNKNCVVAQAEGHGKSLAEKRPEFPVVMFDDKIFFQVKKKASKEGEVIDLCLDEVSNVGAPAEVRCADEDCVMFVSYTPAPEVSISEDRTETRAGPAPEDNNTTLTDCSQAMSSLRESHTQQPQISSGPSTTLCPVADHKLKQMFGITSDVEIRLPRLVSSDTEISAAVKKVPSVDYTEPIEEDFLCPGPPHSQDCPQVEGSASRVGRTRKRTKCPCCSPAILHHFQKGRPKSEHNEKRETARRQLKLQPPPASESVTAAATTSATTSQTAPKLPELQMTEANVPELATTTVSATTPLKTVQVPRKKVKLKPSSVTISPISPKKVKLKPSSVTTSQISPKKVKLKPPSVTISQISRKKVKLKPPSATALQIPQKRGKVKLPPVTVPPSVITSQVPQKQTKLPETPGSAPTTSAVTTLQIPHQKRPSAAPSTVPPPDARTSSVISQWTTPKADSEEMEIHKEIALLREALRLKEAALQKLKSDRNR